MLRGAKNETGPNNEVSRLTLELAEAQKEIARLKSLLPDGVIGAAAGAIKITLDAWLETGEVPSPDPNSNLQVASYGTAFRSAEILALQKVAGQALNDLPTEKVLAFIFENYFDLIKDYIVSISPQELADAIYSAEPYELLQFWQANSGEMESLIALVKERMSRRGGYEIAMEQLSVNGEIDFRKLPVGTVLNLYFLFNKNPEYLKLIDSNTIKGQPLLAVDKKIFADTMYRVEVLPHEGISIPYKILRLTKCDSVAGPYPLGRIKIDSYNGKPDTLTFDGKSVITDPTTLEGSQRVMQLVQIGLVEAPWKPLDNAGSNNT